MPVQETVPTLILAPGKIRARLCRAVLAAGGRPLESPGCEPLLALVHEQAAGAGVVRRLREDGVRAVLGVASARSGARLALLEEGADDVVCAGVGEAELVLRLRALIRLVALRGRSRDLEAAVRESVREVEAGRALFQAVVDALPVSLYAIDRQYRIRVWNRAREDGPFGRPRGEVLGKSLLAVTGEDPELFREFDAVFREGVGRVSEVEGRAVDPPRLFRVEKVPMRLGGGEEVTHVITFARDITEQRAFERAMAQTEKLAAVGQLAAGIAHEIKNPLMTVASCAEGIKAQVAGEPGTGRRQEIAADAQLIEDEAFRCTAILDELLDFSRAGADRRGPVDPAGLGHRVVHLLRHNPRLSGVKLELNTAPDLPELMANPDQIVQVLLALILNAVDAAGPAGRVALKVDRDPGGEVVLAVEDDGPGIPPEIRDRIFEPFFTTKPPGKGTGLGLAVAYGLVRAHGGRFQVHSQPGQGTRFEIRLPAFEPAAAAPATTQAEGTR